MIGVAIPFINQSEITYRCLENLAKFADGDVELILIDNGSSERMTKIPQFWGTHYIRNEKNKGVLPSLVQALEVTNSDYLLHMHNDVLLWEQGWDTRFKTAFENPSIGLVGLFGAKGIGPDGARLDPESNMLGKEWGTPGNLHGYLLTTQAPAVIFDSLAMAWRVKAIKEVGIADDMPPHHWYDRILTLRMIEAGWDCLTLGVAFDHAGSLTYGATDFNQFAKDWLEAHNIPTGGQPDFDLYQYGMKIFEKEYAWRLPLRVNDNFEYSWTR